MTFIVCVSVYGQEVVIKQSQFSFVGVICSEQFVAVSYFIVLNEYVTVHEKTRYKLEIAILDNTHLKVQTLCYFMLKSDWPNGDKITSV